MRNRKSEMAATIPADPEKDALGFQKDDDRRPADEDGNRSTNGDSAATAVAEPGEQEDLFPDLDTSDPNQKELLRAAKKYAKAKAEREALLSTSKEKVDGLMAKCIALMHQANVTKFKYKGVKAELIQTKEKVEVEMDDDDSDDE